MLLGTVDFFVAIHYTMRPREVGEVAAAVLCWFVGFRRGACSLPVSPLTPPLSWHPLVHPFIFPSIHLFLKTGPPSDWVNESRVPLKA